MTLRNVTKQSILAAFQAKMQALVSSTNTAIANVTRNTSLPSIMRKAQIIALQKQFHKRAQALKVQLRLDLATVVPAIVTVAPAIVAPAIVAPAIVAPEFTDVPLDPPTVLHEPLTATVKRALLVGCNYTGSQYQLSGCINDINNLKSRITASYGFLEENITILTDKTPVKPTKANILAAFKVLLDAGRAGDTLLFQFSGHGSSTIDKNGDEVDKLDELIVPSDFKYISDDDLKALLMDHLKKGVTVVALFDSCHSGTAMDLRHQYSPVTTVSSSKETLGQAILISGCKDSQTSADSFEDGQYQGAMTWAFLKATKPKQPLSWNQLVVSMRSILAASKYTQVPQLSSGMPLDLAAPVCFTV